MTIQTSKKNCSSADSAKRTVSISDISARKRIRLHDEEQIVLRAAGNTGRDKVNLYRIIPEYGMFKENSDEIYVAVPGGSSVTVSHLPAGEFSIELI